MKAGEEVKIKAKVNDLGERRTAELVNTPHGCFLEKIKPSKIDKLACVIEREREREHKRKFGMREAEEP